jgi:peptidyl-tRNA hydrolase
MGHYEVKQTIVIRKDLPWTKGKMCAMAAHASLKVFFDRMVKVDSPDTVDGEPVYSINLSKEMAV